MNRLLASLSLAVLLGACQPAVEPAADSAAGTGAETAAETAAETSADTAPPPAEAATNAPAADQAAAEITHPTLVVDTLDHGRFDLSAQRGQWVVVNFWATWCKPCIKEIPDLSAFDAARDDVQVIGLAYEEIETADLREFLGRHPAGYPIAVLDVYDPPADFDTPRGLPMTYLIDPEGRIARKFLGPITSDDLAEAIAAQG